MAATIQKTGKVVRWGNNLGIRIPPQAIKQLRIKEGESIQMRISNGSITIRRAKQRKKWSEEELLKGVTPDICAPDLIPDRAGREIL